MEITKIIESLPKYTQVLYNDCMMHLIKDENIASPIRKKLIETMIQLVKDQLDAIEKYLSENS